MIKRIFLGLFVFILAIVCAVFFYAYWISQERSAFEDAPANYTCHFTDRAACEKAQAWLQKQYEEHPIPSISVAVSIQGKQVFSGTVGLANIETQSAAQTTTQYQIGSVTKVFTAALALRMQELGQVKLSNNFNDYVTDYGLDTHQPYTLLHLLSHQSGIRHYKDELAESLNDVNYQDTRAAAAIVEQDPLAFKPGQDFLYTNYGYSILALALEEASALPFDELLMQRLIVEFNLSSTSLNKANVDYRNLATPYLVLGSTIFEAPKINYSNKYAGAGMISTPADLAAFGSGLLLFHYLSPTSVEDMFDPISIKDVQGNEMPNPQNYGLGVRIDDSPFGRMVHHGGTINGGYSFLAMYPQQTASLAFAMNAVPPEGLDRQENANELLSYFVSEGQ